MPPFQSYIAGHSVDEIADMIISKFNLTNSHEEVKRGRLEAGDVYSAQS